jgi:HEAT repeat protein
MAMGRGTADALFFKRYGIEVLPPMYSLLGVRLMTVSTLYLAISDLVPAERFFKILLSTLVGLLLLNWLLMSTTNSNTAYPIYFLIYEIASELLLVHAALYLGQNFETLQAKRLYPLIFAGAQVGSILGGVFLATAAPALGIQNVLLVWSGLLLMTLAIITQHHRRYGVSPFYRPGRKSRARIKQSIEQLEQALKFLKKSDLLKSMSIAFFFMVITFYVLCYSVNRIYTESFASEEELTAFFGILAASTSVFGLLLQLFVSGNIIRRFGVKSVNLLFPVTTFACFIGLIFSPTLPAAILGSINKDAFMPAFRTPVRNIFFNALPSYVQGRARVLSVALVLPLALITAGILLSVAQQLQDAKYFLLLGLVTSFFYLIFNKRSNREYVSGVLSILRDKVSLPDPDKEISFDKNDKEIINDLIKGVRHKDDEISLVYSKMLISLGNTKVIDVVIPRLKSAGIKMVDQLARELARFKSEEIELALLSLINRDDPHLQSTILMAMIEHEKRAAIPFIIESLDSSNPRLNVVGIYGALTFPELTLEEKAFTTWRRLLNDKLDGAVIAGISLLKIKPEHRFSKELVSSLNHDNLRVKKASLTALVAWPFEEPDGLLEALQSLKHHPEPFIREKIIQCASLLSDENRIDFAQTGLEDDHPGVRIVAAKSLVSIDHSHEKQAPQWIISGSVSHKAQEALLTALLDSPISTAQLRKIAQAKAQESQEITAAAHKLMQEPWSNKTSNPIELLYMVLTERRNKAVNLFLSAMERIEDAEIIGLIRSGLNSNDPRHIANAAEALRNISDDELSRSLVDMLDNITPLQTENSSNQNIFDTVHDVLLWCKERSDPWLTQCAQYAIDNMPAAGTQNV